MNNLARKHKNVLIAILVLLFIVALIAMSLGSWIFHETKDVRGIDPPIDGMAFLLSAFGLVELAYAPPRNEVFRTNKNLYLTPFDGAHAVRLTDVGRGTTPAVAVNEGGPAVAFLQDGRLRLSQLDGFRLECVPGRLCNAPVDMS